MPQSTVFTHSFHRPPDPLGGVHVITIEVPVDKFIRNLQVTTEAQNGGSASLSGASAFNVTGSQQIAVAWALLPIPGSHVKFSVRWDVLDMQQGQGRVLLFRDRDFQGPMLEVNDAEPNLVARSFNDAASSIVVLNGQWAFYEDIQYARPYASGRTLRLLGRGMYPWVPQKGISNDRLSSLRAVL